MEGSCESGESAGIRRRSMTVEKIAMLRYAKQNRNELTHL